jgi:CubicO group peptidase (beta-lactamase class C family)
MTTVAALQCVERGLVTLDEDATRVLPELKNLEILTGFNQRTQRPVFARRRRQLTLRFV